MARVKVKFDSVAASKKLEMQFKDKVKFNRQMNEEIGEFLVQRIRSEARRGRPLNKSRRFPNLKSSSVRSRDRLSRFNKTGGPFRPSLSNLTLTGQLLDSIKFEFARAKGVIEVFARGKRKPYKTGPQRSARKTPISSRNEILDAELRKKGFKAFTPQGIKAESRITKRINNIVKRFLRRSLGVSKRLDKL
jgi:hypothetical protein